MTLDTAPQIDRMEPTRRPSGRNAGTQSWQNLLFCHWRVPADSIVGHLPDGLQLDTLDGQAFLGIVPFQMRNIRPNWLPERLGFNFLETNLRTYVTCQGRPGVYFFSLDANSWPAVMAARVGWSLPYQYARMTESSSESVIEYRSERVRGYAQCSNALHEVHFVPGQRLGPSKPGTLEHFLFERYLLFVAKGGRIHVGQVHHHPYEVWQASIRHIEEHLVEAAGMPATIGPPDLAHYSPGVDVEVFSIKPVTRNAT